MPSSRCVQNDVLPSRFLFDMKESFYFSHDYNSRQDVKIKSLLRKHGIVAYGIFWAIIEDLYQNANALPTDYEGIAYELRVDETLVKSIINDFDLFVFKDGMFGSLSVQRRIDERNAKSTKARDSAFARWNKDANALQPQSDSNAIKEIKGKEIKEKESKEPDDLFEKFWNLYDKKKGKDKTILQWNKLKTEEKEKAIEGISFYQKYQPETKYRKDPERYLSNKVWEDEEIYKSKQLIPQQPLQGYSGAAMQSLDHLGRL